MSLCVKEFKAKNVVFVADKGFFSEDNVKMLDTQQLQYIIPLRRNNAMIDLSPSQEPGFKKNIKNHFMYQNRAIWYWQYERNGRQLITFLDDYLRVNEENDYLQRITTKPEEFTQEGFVEKLPTFGTLTIVHKTKKALCPNEIYETYKLRNEIEIMFDSYKNYLDADVTYMQDRYVLDGWLFANFIAMTAYCKLFARLKQANLIHKYSPKDIVEISKAIFMIKNGNQWLLSETSAKTRAIFNKINIDYLT
jgi:transposase